MNRRPTTVAEYLRTQIALSGRSQRDIAREMGYENPNIITMFKQGHTKVPPAAVESLARAIGADPAHLLRLVLGEYEPKLLALIDRLLTPCTVITQDEASVLTTVRSASQRRRLDLGEPWAAKMLYDAIDGIATASEARARAALDAYERLPKNVRARSAP